MPKIHAVSAAQDYAAKLLPEKNKAKHLNNLARYADVGALLYALHTFNEAGFFVQAEQADATFDKLVFHGNLIPFAQAVAKIHKLRFFTGQHAEKNKDAVIDCVAAMPSHFPALLEKLEKAELLLGGATEKNLQNMLAQKNPRYMRALLDWLAVDDLKPEDKQTRLDEMFMHAHLLTTIGFWENVNIPKTKAHWREIIAVCEAHQSDLKEGRSRLRAYICEHSLPDEAALQSRGVFGQVKRGHTDETHLETETSVKKSKS